MKYIISLMGFLMILGFSSAQQKTIKQSKVPQNVQDALKTKFPDATKNKWTIENNSYTAKCKQGKKKLYAAFSADGKWLKTTVIIQWKEVPEVVKTAYNISTNKNANEKWKTEKVTQIDSSDGTTIYVVEMDNEWFIPSDSDAPNETCEIYISSTGKIIKTIRKG
ncbi:MAG: PepSY-like domain-containing protein [Bacteroidia bacterium]